jgi:hypothetical protein
MGPVATIPNPNWPLTVTQVAFNAGLNFAGPPTWTDLTSRMWSFGCGRGRQYELDQVQAGLGRVVLADRDEYLNPANTSSPYSPNVLPYRQIMMQAQWPPAPVGAATNLLSGQGIDPSFESYPAASSLPWVLTSGTGVTPTVVAANPQQGTKSLTYNVAAGGGTSGVGLAVTCIPGQQYTSSLYVRQVAANTTQVFINAGPAGSTTTTTGAYVRLTLTWTATQPTHQLWVASFGTSLSGAVNVDAIQHEPGAAVTAFATSGPTIYGVHRGFVERWPSRWNHNGMYGYAEITTVDGFAALAANKLHTEYRNMLLAKKPSLWWTLSDGSDATAWAETSGNNGPALTRQDLPGDPAAGPINPVTFTSGTDVSIAGDPGATGVTISYADGAEQHPITTIQTGQNGKPKIRVNATGTVAAFSVALWASWAPMFTNTAGYFLTMFDDAYTCAFDLGWNRNVGGGGMFRPQIETLAGTFGPATYDVTAYSDNKPHLIVATVDIAVAGTTVKLYIDGTLVATSPADPNPALHKQPNPYTQIILGALATPSTGHTYAGLPGAVYNNLAIWGARALSAQDVTDLWTASKGYPDETSGARIGRYLGGNYNGPIAIDTGQSTMGVSNLAEDTGLLDACQAVTLSENGNFWVDGDGTLTFVARTRRYLATTSQFTFGEQENPYEDDIAYDYDATLIYNDVSVQQSAGTNAAAFDATSQTNYGPRSYQRQTNVASGLETIDAATWILATHKDPHQRISTLTIKPSHNPTLWPVALGAEIGQRVTVKRRTTAGLTMSADYFIEQISHSQKPDEWTVSFQMSPAIGYQVGLFNDATYGQFNSTLIFGY